MSKHNSMPLLHLYTKQITVILAKIILVCSAFAFIYSKLVYNDTLDMKRLFIYINEHQILTFKNACVLLIFTSANWLLESLKWQLLVHEVQNISLRQAIVQSLGSLTASILTPNRIGEYGAKAIYFKKEFRKRVVGLNLIGNLTQLITTLFFGSIGLCYIIYIYQLPISYLNLLIFGVLIACFIIFYYTVLSKKEFEIKGYSFKKLNRFVISLKRQILFKALTLSVLRYVCFSHQFYLLIWLFGVEITYFDALALITAMYLLTSIIPTIFIFDVLVKGSIAVWLFSFANANEFIIATCVTVMWGLNFALPSVLGSYFVLNFKFPED